MKEIVDILQSKGLLFKSLKPIDIKELGSRKKLFIYLGVDLKSYYTSIIYLKKKSKVYTKDAKEIVELHKRLELFNDSKIDKKILYIQAPLCTKAKSFLKEQKWKVWK